MGGELTDTGRHIGPASVKDPITGQLKSLEEQRRARNPVAVARKEGWEVGHSLGDVALRKDGRSIVLNEHRGAFCNGSIKSDTDTTDRYKKTIVTSSLAQVRAALRGTLCTCGPRSVVIGRESFFEYDRTKHEATCPLDAV